MRQSHKKENPRQLKAGDNHQGASTNSLFLRCLMLSGYLNSKLVSFLVWIKLMAGEVSLGQVSELPSKIEKHFYTEVQKCWPD